MRDGIGGFKCRFGDPNALLMLDVYLSRYEFFDRFIIFGGADSTTGRFKGSELLFIMLFHSSSCVLVCYLGEMLRYQTVKDERKKSE